MIQGVDDPASPIGYYLLTLAAALVSTHPLQAARIHGKALKELEGLEKLGEALLDFDILPAAELLKSAAGAGRMGLEAYARAQTEGASLSLDELLSAKPAEERSYREPDARAQSPRPLTELKAEKARFAGLTAREREVAVLITHGLTNSSIADQMMLSERTVTTHISNILSKLGYTSRTQIAAWAVEKGLVSPSAR
jgi:DNA-binding CsgD family transcriptional regulator